MKVIRSLEYTEILSEETNKKNTSPEGGFPNFLRSFTTAG